MKMIFFELKKYVFKPSVLAFLVVFAILNFVKFFEIYCFFGGGRYALIGDDSMGEGYKVLYRTYGGEITSEKIDAMKAEYAEAQQKLEERGTDDTKYDDCYTGYPYGDTELFRSTFIPGYEYGILYSNYAKEICAAADENVDFYSGINGYEERKNQIIADTFKGRYVDYYVKDKGWTALFDYKFSTILVMLMIVLAFSSVFSMERAGCFDNLIISSGKRKSAVCSKLAAAGIFTFGVTLMFFLLDILYTAVIYGIDCLAAPVYAIEDYMNCPFTVTLGGTLLLSFLGRLFSMMFFAAAVCFISSFGKNTALSLFLSAVLGAALIFLSDILPEGANIMGLAHISHFLEKFSTVNLFGFPVFSAAAVLSLSFVLTAGLVTVTARRALK